MNFHFTKTFKKDVQFANGVVFVPLMKCDHAHEIYKLSDGPMVNWDSGIWPWVTRDTSNSTSYCCSETHFEVNKK